MVVAVMDVRVVRVRVGKGFVAVPMRVVDVSGKLRIVHCGMRMPMMLVVIVRMLVLQHIVSVLVHMAFGEMKPYAGRH